MRDVNFNLLHARISVVTSHFITDRSTPSKSIISEYPASDSRITGHRQYHVLPHQHLLVTFPRTDTTTINPNSTIENTFGENENI